MNEKYDSIPHDLPSHTPPQLIFLRGRTEFKSFEYSLLSPVREVRLEEVRRELVDIKAEYQVRHRYVMFSSLIYKEVRPDWPIPSRLTHTFSPRTRRCVWCGRWVRRSKCATNSPRRPQKTQSKPECEGGLSGLIDIKCNR